MIIESEKPIVGAEGERSAEKRERRERELPHLQGVRGISVTILRNRKSPEQKRSGGEEDEIEKRTDEEKIPIQISALAVEHRIVSGRDVRPFIKMVAKEQDRDEEHRHERQKHREIFELPSHHDRPFRIGHVMHDDPEETAGEQREIKREREEPRETELMRRDECAYHAQRQPGESDQSQDE